MVKKLRTLTEADDNQLVEAVRSSAHLIWQAGLGAFSRAQEEGDKAFENLMNAGSDLQKRMEGVDEGMAPDLAATVGRAVDMVGKQAADSWGKVEHAFEDRLSRTLHDIGVPTRDDIRQLAQQIDELRNLVEVLSSKGAAAEKGMALQSAMLAAKKPATRVSATTRSKAATKNPATKKTMVAKAAAESAERKAPRSSA